MRNFVKEAELKFISLPSAEEVLRILKKWFGFYQLIVKQVIKAHRDVGRILSSQERGERVFLKASEHGRIINSMILLAGEVEKQKPHTAGNN